MKKFIAFLSFFLILLCGSLSLKAQTIQYGIVGGVNFAKITNYASYGNPNRRIGGVFGIFADFPIAGSKLSIRPELLYSQEGLNVTSHYQIYNCCIIVSATETAGNDPVEHTKLKLSYLKFPVLLKYNFLPNSVVSPNIYAGPYFAVNIVAKKEGSFSSVSYKEKETSDVRSFTKAVDAGFVGGIGVEIAGFELSARYSFGLIGIDKNSSQHRKNSVLSVILGINFR